MNRMMPWAQRLLGLAVVLACVTVLMGADRRVGRVPAATGELTLLSGASGTFDVVAANAELSDFEVLSVHDGSLGTASMADGVIHYSADPAGSGIDRVGYQLRMASGQRVLGELRVRVLDAQAEVAMRVHVMAASRSGVPVELRDGDTVVATGVTGGNGVVDLMVPAGWDGEAMLALHAQGVGASGAALRWVSALGSVRQLRMAAAGGRLEAPDWPPLRLGASSTAFHATLLAIDSAAAVDEDAAMRAAAGVDPHRVLVGAALVDVIEGGGLELPPGYADTHALLGDAAEVDRLRNAHWFEHVDAAMQARLLDPAKSVALGAQRYEAWFHLPGAHDVLLDTGTGVALHEGGGGEYFSTHQREDAGLQWQQLDGGLRIELHEPRVTDENGGQRLPGICTLPDGTEHEYRQHLLTRRGTLDLRRLYAFAGTDYLVQRWHREKFYQLVGEVPAGCEVELLPGHINFELDFSLTRPNLDTTVSVGPAAGVPERLLVALGAFDLAGLLDLPNARLDLDGAALDIDVHLARAGRIVFDALSDDGGLPVRFDLQLVREGQAGSALWGVTRRSDDEAVRGWLAPGIEPQAIRADFDWNGAFIHHRDWSRVGTLGRWRTAERWVFDEEAQRALAFRKSSAGGDWEAYPHLDHDFRVEAGAAIARRYYVGHQWGLVECPPGLTCWRQNENRLLPLAEVRDAFGPGLDLVYVMREYGLLEDEEGWSVFQRFVDAYVRDPSGTLGPAPPPRTMGDARQRMGERQVGAGRTAQDAMQRR